MKIALLALAVFGLPLVSRGENAPHSAAQAALAQKIKQAFPYDPAASQKKEEQTEPDSSVVTMARFTVVESAPLRQLQAKMDAEREKKKTEEFSITKGGALLKKDIGKARIEIGPMGDGSVFNFLRVSW